MLTGKRHLPASRLTWSAVICLALGGLLAAGCGPSASDSSTSGLESQKEDEETFLRANPNPVLGGESSGKTTVTWNTKSNDVGEVYIVADGDEKLFATGVKGSKEATGLKETTKFRLYTQAGHKLVDELKVVMSASDVPPSHLSLAPPSATP